jgi:hypothetical protein
MSSPDVFKKFMLWIAGVNIVCVLVALGLQSRGLLPWGRELWIALLVLSLAQLLCGFIALFDAGTRRAGILALLTTPLVWGVALLTLLVGLGGGGWGRPLRVRGRQLHSGLREGSDWTSGPLPEVSALDPASRHALAALWLHDAQKEHASVPAFSRIAWLLAAVGAPAELMAWSHRAALEEIDHAQKCFALAAGYGGRQLTVQPMPDLLLGGLDCKADPLVTLATESIGDGCQLEDFNADVAAECACACEEPVTRAVLEQIAREERSHAEFSWALLQWLLQHHSTIARPAVEKALLQLDEIKRPTAVSWDKRRLVSRADETQLRRHGRIPDTRWGELWSLRSSATRQRLGQLLAAISPTASPHRQVRDKTAADRFRNARAHCS